MVVGNFRFLKFGIVAAFMASACGGNVATQTLPFCHEIKSTLTIPVDPCASNPCVNGDCSSLEGGQFECRNCTNGWQGSLCNTGFLCGDIENTCLSFSAICNRTYECPNRFDESACCGDAPGFACERRPYCLPLDRLCDGVRDCDYDEIIYCGRTCTVTASPMLSTETSTPSITPCITTPVYSSAVPTSEPSTQTTGTTYNMTTNQQVLSSTATFKRDGKSFFDETTNIAGVAAGLGVIVLGGAGFILAAKFYKTKKQGSNI